MAEDNKLITRENGSHGAVEIVPSHLPAWNLSPHEPHLYDYLLTLRKHQWLILSFVLAVVTITSIGTFRMQPVYVAPRVSKSTGKIPISFRSRAPTLLTT